MSEYFNKNRTIKRQEEKISVEKINRKEVSLWIEKHYIKTGIIVYFLLWILTSFVNIEILNNLYRPFEVMSTALSFLILKEISDIRKESYKKANSEKHEEGKIENKNIEFFKLYTDKKITIQNIKKKCETFHDMKEEVLALKSLQSFLSMFQGKIANNIYDKENIETYKEKYNQFVKSIEVFSLNDEDFKIINEEEKVNYYENNIDLIDDSVTCIKQHFEYNESIQLKYASMMEENIKKEEEEKTTAADNQDDESL